MARDAETHQEAADSGRDRLAAARTGATRARGGRPLVSIPRLEIETRQNGRRFVQDPSPLKDMPPAQRLRRIKAVLELAALQGDVSAACELLRQQRWEAEMRREAEGKRVVRVVDSLSARGATGVPPAAADESRPAEATCSPAQSHDDDGPTQRDGSHRS